MTTVSLLTAQGISALKAGNKDEAQRWLRLALKRNPNDISAWLWLSGAVDNDDERLECLQQVLRIDPRNEPALAGIAKLSIEQKPLAAQPVEQPPIPAPEIEHKTEIAPFVDTEEDERKPARTSPDKVSPFVLEKHKKKRKQQISERTVFDVRPSLIPVFLSAMIIFISLGVASWLLLEYSDSATQIITVLLIVFGLLILINLVMIFRTMIHYASSRYRLTTWNLIVQAGVVSRNHIKIPVGKIRHVTGQRRFPTRIFGVGDVFVNAASGKGQVKLKSLLLCQKRVDQILKVIELHR